MTALANLTSPSFFEEIPLKAISPSCRAWDAITGNQPVTLDAVFVALCRDVASRQVEPPARADFLEWARNVRAGHTARPLVIGVPLPARVAPRSSSPQIDRAMKAYAIIAQALKLQQAMIEGGYSPDSVEMEDQIVAEAIKDWLTSEAGDWSEATNLDCAPGEIAIQLLSTKDRDQNAKLLDVFATHMQRELALAIVEGRAKGGAA